MGLIKSIIDNAFRDTVAPMVGSVVYCDLALGFADHSGVYVGRGRIIHLNGDGLVESVPATKFLERLGGYNIAISIYVSCKGGKPVGGKYIADRARKMLKEKRRYNFIFNNCHQFTSGCVTGDFDNNYSFLWMLKNEVSNKVGADKWRVWERSSKSWK